MYHDLNDWSDISVLIFGLKVKPPNQEYLYQVQQVLKNHILLQRLLPVIESLPDLLLTLPRSNENVSTVSEARDNAQILVDWVVNGNTSKLSDSNSGIVVLPLLLLIQITQYFEFLKHHRVSHAELITHVNFAGGVQGYCGGLPSAIAVACSEDEGQLVNNVAIALRLAFTIGFYGEIGLEEMSHDFGMIVLRLRYAEQADEILTLFEDVSTTWMLHKEYPTKFDLQDPVISDHRSKVYAQEKDLLVQNWPLRGRWHHTDNVKLSEELSSWCNGRDEFQFVHSNRTAEISLRSNRTGNLTPTCDLSHELITSILSSRSEWHSVLSNTARSLLNGKRARSHVIVTFGCGDCTPLISFNQKSLRVIKIDAFELFSANKCKNTPLPARPSDKESIVRDLTDPLKDSIAIVGAACRLPGAENLEELWDLLASGKDQHVKLDKHPRLNILQSFRASQSKPQLSRHVYFANLLDDIESFDHVFFNISAKEATNMDPQQRIILEVAYQAMESSGYQNSQEHQGPIGCFIGASTVDFHDNTSSHPPTAYTSTGTIRAFISGKISHFFHWTGPSEVIDTACSSSLVAINRACKAIQTGECTAALAGGINIMTSPHYFMDLGQAGFLSPTGQCKPFDQAADGYCRSDGVGLVVLKSLSQARKDSDQIFGIIRGISTMQNGGIGPIIVPSMSIQTALFKKVLDQADMSALDISYVEAHGTGTAVGDPIEIDAIREVFHRSAHGKNPALHVGSIKGNIGHGETAAGVSGLLKILTMINKGCIPPQASFMTLNPKLGNLEASNMLIATAENLWDSQYQHALVNSYGAAGSNSALIVSANIANAQSPTLNSSPHPWHGVAMILSAASETSLKAFSKKLAAYLSNTIQKPDFLNVAYTLSRKRQRHKFYSAIHAFDNSDLCKKLEGGAFQTQRMNLPRKSVVLVLSGQSKQTVGLDRDLVSKSLRFKSHLHEIDSIVQSLGYPSVLPVLFQTDSPILDPCLLQLGLATVQLTHARCWIEAGLKIEAIIGHSLGELVGLGISGILSERDCLALIGFRATLIKRDWNEDKGSMIVIRCSLETAELLISIMNEKQRVGVPKWEIACHNAPNSYVIAGPSSGVIVTEDLLRNHDMARTVSFQPLDVSHAFHSQLTSPILTELDRFAASLTWNNSPKITLEVCQQHAQDNFRAYSSARHAREPVYFYDAVNRVEDRLRNCLFLECDMDSSIIPMVRRAVQNPSKHSFQRVTRQENFSELIIQLWKDGVEVMDWSLLDHPRHQIWLPPYEFDKTRHWIPNVDHAARLQTQLLTSSDSMAQFKLPKNLDKLISLVKTTTHEQSKSTTAEFKINTTCSRFERITGGHRVRGRPMVPATFYLEFTVEALSILRQDITQKTLRFRHIRYHNPIGLRYYKELTIDLSNHQNANVYEFTVRSLETQSTIHATGQISIQSDYDFYAIERILSDNVSQVSNNTNSEFLSTQRVYRLFNQVVEYDPFFKGIHTISIHQREASAEIQVPKDQPGVECVKVRAKGDSVTLDICIQVVGLSLNSSDEVGPSEVMVGTGIQELIISESCELDQHSRLTVFSKFGHIDESTAEGDVIIYSEKKKIIGLLLGCKFMKISSSRMEKALDLANTQSVGSFSGTAAPSLGLSFDLSTQSNSENCEKRPDMGEKSVDTSVAYPRDVAKLFQLISEYSGAAESDVSRTSTLRELGIDSLAARELAGELETSLGISVDPIALQEDCIDTILRRRNLDDFSQESSQAADASTQVGEATLSKNPQSACPASEDSMTKLWKILCDISGAQVNAFSENQTLSDLGLDSYMLLKLKQEIELAFSISLGADTIDSQASILDIMRDLNISRMTILSDVDGSLAEVLRSSNSMSSERNAENGSGTRTELLPVPAEELKSCEKSFANVAKEHGFADYWAKVAPSQDKLLLSYICEAFADLDVDLNWISSGSIVTKSSLHYQPRYEKVVDRFFCILERNGILRRGDGLGYIRTSKPVPQETSNDLYEAFLRDHRAYRWDAELMSLTGTKLADCLRGKAEGMDCLFGNARAWKIMELFYYETPMLLTVNEQLTTFLISYIQKTRFALQHQHRPLEILEVGAGTGGTTKQILAALSSCKLPVKYTLSDISPSLIRRARKTFAQYESWMEFKVFDLEKEPDSTMKSRFDIILGTNSVHATTDRVKVLERLRRILNETGFVVLSETTQVLDWLDLVFGLLDGWWLAENGTVYPLQPAEIWMSYFEKAGYASWSYSKGSSPESNTQQLLLACKARTGQADQRLESFSIHDSGNDYDDRIPGKEPRRWRKLSMTYKSVDDMNIDADVFLPRHKPNSARALSLAFLIHDGGCFALSKRSTRPAQISFLLNNGILPISPNYRLCPETNMVDGAMEDLCDLYLWTQSELPSILKDATLGEITIDPTRSIIIGYSTGGHLSLSLSWFLRYRTQYLPKAIVCFYSPTIFSEGSLRVPSHGTNTFRRRLMPWSRILSSLPTTSVVAHEPTVKPHMEDDDCGRDLSWLFAAQSDPRAELVLSIMTEQTGLALLLNDIPCGEDFLAFASLASSSARQSNGHDVGNHVDDNAVKQKLLFPPTKERVCLICPLANVRAGKYTTPTFFAHGDADIIAPFQDAELLCYAMQEKGIEAKMLRLKGVGHLYDVHANPGSLIWEEQVLPALLFAVQKLEDL